MARAGKCPTCNLSRVLYRLKVLDKQGEIYFIYLCQECLDNINKNSVKSF